MELAGGKTAARGAGTRLVHVERGMNDYNAMTVHVVKTGELQTVVGCVSLGLRERLASATTESEFPLRLAPSPGCGNSWVALGR